MPGDATGRATGPPPDIVRGWSRVAQVAGGIIVVIPLLLILRHLHLVNTLVGVPLAETVATSAFGIWVLAGAVK